jgi:CRISPR/Cas system-associated exonuclease Cas4 (RecB family)
MCFANEMQENDWLKEEIVETWVSTMIDFEEMIDNYLFREFKPKTIGRYYPSEIGSCLRKMWYSYKVPKEVEPKLKRIFEVGNIVHGFVVDVLKSEKNPHVELLKTEEPFQMKVDDFVISGRIDDIIELKQNGETILVEAKSAKSTDYVREPSPTYLMQLQLYMHQTKIHKGIILYVEKNTLKSKVFNVNYDERVANEAIERFRKIDKCLKEDSVPFAESKRRVGWGWMCGYCQYKEECDKIGDEEIKASKE